MSLEALAAKVRLVVFDVDGVMTNGQLILGPAGEELKVFHVRDGHGLVMLRQSGLAVAVITGRQSAVVAARMAELGIEFVYQIFIRSNDVAPNVASIIYDYVERPKF